MSAKELRAKSAADLQKELLDLRREQFNLRMTRATGQSVKPDQFTKVRRNIARLKTVQGEQRRAAPAPAPQATQAAVKPAPKKQAPKKQAQTTKGKKA
jgi:large subunit ribosomal protein L29